MTRPPGRAAPTASATPASVPAASEATSAPGHRSAVPQNHDKGTLESTTVGGVAARTSGRGHYAGIVVTTDGGRGRVTENGPKPSSQPGQGLRPLSGPGATARIVPFAAVGALAVGMAILPPRSGSAQGALVATAAITAALIAAAVLVPWRRLPAWCEASIPLLAFVGVATLREAGAGVASGYAPVVLLPILWIALYGGYIQLRLAIVATGVVFIGPLILLGSPNYPASSWRGCVLWVVIGLLAGTSIQSLVARARQRTADVAALGVLTRALGVGADPRPELCGAAQLVTGAAFAVLFERHEDGTLVATAGTAGIDLAQMRIDPATEISATAEAWRSGARIYIPDVRADLRASARLADQTGASAALFQPVTRDGRRSAVLVVGFHESRPRMPELSLYMIELVSAEIAAAVDRANLVVLLAAQARTDPLTGAANRRSWDEELEREVASAGRTGLPLSVALIDMDHFKAYNDAFGHTVGDALLRDLVIAVRAELRVGDVIARWGGEEFSLALPGCDLAQAQEVADRLLSVVPSGQTASIGLTEAGPFDTARTLIGRADSALYAAKDLGRNRVVALPASSTPVKETAT